MLVQPLVARNSMAGWEKWQYMMGAWNGEGVVGDDALKNVVRVVEG